MATVPDDILSIDQLATYLKISKSTLYKLAVENKLPGQKVGKRWRFRKATVDAWLNGAPQDADRTNGTSGRGSKTGGRGK